MKVKKAKWLVVLMVVAMLFALVPATASADHEGPGSYAFIPNSGEASVSKVFLGDDDTDAFEVARYYTAEREDPDPYDWRTSRNAMDEDGNGWVINTGADGDDLQGSIVRIQMDTEDLANTNDDPDDPLDFGTDEAVQVFDVEAPGDMPRAIAIDEDGYIWVGFYGGGQLVQYEYDEANEELDLVGGPYTPDEEFHIGYYEMDFAPDGTLWISSRDSTPDVNPTVGVWSFDGTDFERETTFNPYSILIDPDDGTVYASSYTERFIWRSDTDDEITIADDNQALRGMAFDEDGLIWIASTTEHSGGDRVYWFDPETEDSGFITIDTEYGTTPVGVGMDARGVMWVVLRTDDADAGFIQGFTPDPEDPEFYGAVEVGERPYAYGVFSVPEVPTYEICGFKYLAVWDDEELVEGDALDGWTITLEKWDDDEEEWVFHHETLTGTVYDNDDPIDGKYCFDDLTEGKYRVTEEVKDGWNQVYPYDEDAAEGYEYAYVIELPDGATYADSDNPDYYNFINEPPELEVVCETAWAYGGDEADDVKANNTVDGNPSNAWGWTNQVGDGVHYEFDLYTGAGQNDLEKGELVGTVTVHIEGEDSWVRYELDDPDCWLSEVHLWVGETPLPEARRGATAAPGQFNYSAYPDADSYEFGFDAADYEDEDGNIWIAAHAVVCCYEVMEE